MSGMLLKSISWWWRWNDYDQDDYDDDCDDDGDDDHDHDDIDKENDNYKISNKYSPGGYGQHDCLAITVAVLRHNADNIGGARWNNWNQDKEIKINTLRYPGEK